jgi:hypothetical protein
VKRVTYTLFFFDPTATRLDARTVLQRVADDDATAAGSSPRVLAFVEEAFRRLPALEQVETEVSTSPGSYFIVNLPLSFDEALVSQLMHLAESHGLTAYDPQMDAEEEEEEEADIVILDGVTADNPQLDAEEEPPVYTLFFFDAAAARRDARTVYRLVWSGDDLSAAGNSRRVEAFIEEVDRRLLVLGRFGSEESTGPLCSGHFFIVHLTLPLDEGIVSQLVQIAESHGLTAYDPQMGASRSVL